MTTPTLSNSTIQAAVGGFSEVLHAWERHAPDSEPRLIRLIEGVQNVAEVALPGKSPDRLNIVRAKLTTGCYEEGYGQSQRLFFVGITPDAGVVQYVIERSIQDGTSTTFVRRHVVRRHVTSS